MSTKSLDSEPLSGVPVRQEKTHPKDMEILQTYFPTSLGSPKVMSFARIVVGIVCFLLVGNPFVSGLLHKKIGSICGFLLQIVAFTFLFIVLGKLVDI